MYAFRKPSDQRISRCLAAQQQLAFSYVVRGATRNEDSSPGYTIDHNRIYLGSGRDVYEAAKQALQSWRHFQLGWVHKHQPDRPPIVGDTVGVLAQAMGLWVLNVCRVVYVTEEQQPLRRYAFAYGTLPRHVESGEERFQVEWHEDDSVWYDIYAFSRPNQLITKLAYPYARRKQRQFAKNSMQAMRIAVNEQLCTNILNGMQSNSASEPRVAVQYPAMHSSMRG